jgi:hypothetical protein
MPHHVTVDVADPDEVLRDANTHGTTRADFFRRGAIAGGTLIAGGVAIGGLPAIALGKPSAAQDVEILNYALLLEYLESTFYTEAVANNMLSGRVLEFARTVRDHELAHVEFLAKTLGSKAIGKPTFDFGDTVRNGWLFLATAVTLEDVGVTAYNGQGTRLTKATLGAAATIASVEARHAAWVRQLSYGPSYTNAPAAPYTYPAPSTLQPQKSMDQVTATVTATGFIKG